MSEKLRHDLTLAELPRLDRLTEILGDLDAYDSKYIHLHRLTVARELGLFGGDDLVAEARRRLAVLFALQGSFSMVDQLLAYRVFVACERTDGAA